MKVIIENHARKRFYERGGNGKLTHHLVRSHLMAAMAQGLRYVNNAVYVRLQGNLWGVYEIINFGWRLVTVVGTDWVIEYYEKAGLTEAEIQIELRKAGL